MKCVVARVIDFRRKKLFDVAIAADYVRDRFRLIPVQLWNLAFKEIIHHLPSFRYIDIE